MIGSDWKQAATGLQVTLPMSQFKLQKLNRRSRYQVRLVVVKTSPTKVISLTLQSLLLQTTCQQELMTLSMIAF